MKKKKILSAAVRKTQNFFTKTCVDFLSAYKKKEEEGWKKGKSASHLRNKCCGKERFWAFGLWRVER